MSPGEVQKGDVLFVGDQASPVPVRIEEIGNNNVASGAYLTGRNLSQTCQINLTGNPTVLRPERTCFSKVNPCFKEQQVTDVEVGIDLYGAKVRSIAMGPSSFTTGLTTQNQTDPPQLLLIKSD